MRVSRGVITVVGDWPVIEQVDDLDTFVKHEQEQVIHLDGRHDAILPDSWIVVETPADHELATSGGTPLVLQARRPNASGSRAEYGMSGPATRVELDKAWIRLPDRASAGHDDFAMIRQTAVYAQAEALELAEEPIPQPVCGGHDDRIELDGFYEDLEAGRWVVVSGEREIESTSGVRFSELSMLSSVSHGVRILAPAGDAGGTSPRPLAGDRTHTFIELHDQLAYCFKRDTVRIHGNVVLATHGETRAEVLGSGDGSTPNQEFVLKQSPLTYVPADAPSGVDTSLEVYISDVQWREADALVGLLPTDRQFVTHTGDDAKTAVVFGNGREGARLPTGVENVRAVYRSGIGRAGNVKGEQISLLSTRPLGAKAVINPLPASGGADRETRDQARRNAPLAVMALDRLVSVQDYEDFARVFAGIGKSHAVELSDGRRQLVHLTIAGADDAPIDPSSSLYRHLTAALRRFGDPDQAFRVDVRELLLLVLSARVRVRPDRRWDHVEPRVRAALVEAFGFERRELGEDALLSVAIAAIQGVSGVEWVDVDVFGGIPERVPAASGRRLLEPGEIARAIQTLVARDAARGPSPRVRVNLAGVEGGRLRPAQLAVLSPLVPATLILNEVPR
jgi:predicted phage baseplate assembly protein